MHWACSPVLPFFSEARLCHYRFTIARKRTECEDREQHMRAHTKVMLLFYLPYSTCSRQSAPTPSQMNFVMAFQILSQRCANERRWCNLNWPGSSQQCTAESKERGHTPPWNKRQVDRPLIYPLPFSLIPHTALCECVCPCAPVHAFICLCWSSTYRIVYDRPNWANWRH